ncbi:HAD family hydrolase [Desulforhopalus sp. 52FAK]
MTAESQLDKIECVMLDFDGVILDSSGLKTDCFKKYYSKFENISEQLMAFHYQNKGMSRFRQFDYIARNILKVSDPKAQVERMANEFAEIVFEVISQANFIHGARELLRFLSPNLPLYVISAAPHNELTKIIEMRQLSHFFVKYYGSVDIKSKMIVQIMKSENFIPNKVLYVGDTLNDLNAAREADVLFCGVKNPLVDFHGEKCIKVSDLRELKEKF